MVTGDILSFNALIGQDNSWSLWLCGEIASQLAKQLGLPIQSTTSFRVYIGNGDFLLCQFVCPQVSLSIQGNVFLMDRHILQIERSDVVLGIQWLQKLGRVAHDYSAFSMEFCWEGKHVILHGDITSIPSLISLHQFQALVHSNEVYSLFELQSISVDTNQVEYTVRDHSDLEFPTSLPEPITSLLHRYSTLFAPPTGLPLIALLIIGFTCFPTPNQSMCSLTIIRISKKSKWRKGFVRCWSKASINRVRAHFLL